MLCIIPTLMVVQFFFNSRNLQTGIQQMGPNQFVENQKNQEITGRFGMKNLPKRLEIFFAETTLPKRPVPISTVHFLMVKLRTLKMTVKPSSITLYLSCAPSPGDRQKKSNQNRKQKELRNEIMQPESSMDRGHFSTETQ